MSEGPWIRFFPSDWLSGTRGMTATETGIYITIIAMMYERGAPIQRDHARLARLCGTTPAAMKDTLTILIDQGKLIVRDGGLWNERVEVEAKIRSEKITQAGKSAKARWKKDKQNQHALDADAMRSQCDSNANQNQNQNQTQKVEEKERKIGSADAPAEDHQNFSAPERAAGKSYVFEGSTIRLTKNNFDKWRDSFRAIPDLRAELQAADDYYTENPPRDGKWFFPVSRWLAKANADATERKEQANYGVTWQ